MAIDLSTQRYALYALLAAALFGISAPLAKALGLSLAPVMLAALLYLGSGLALALWMSVRRWRASDGSPMARVSRTDLPWLIGSVIMGGILGPVALLWGLQSTSGSAASLLLSLEGLITTLIAAVLFREAVDRRVWQATGLMLIASLLLTMPDARSASLPGAMGVLLACLCWAIDNNLTRRIAGADAVLVAMIKGLGAGSFNLLLALSMGLGLGSWETSAGALLLGAASYGLSLVLFILALRHLGSARTAAHFGSAPFFGAGFAVVVMREAGSMWLLAAMLLMALASWLVLTERHEHDHLHESLDHEHEHAHDEHHRHAHDFPWDGRAAHSHRHLHQPLRHRHAHLPDLHHRHTHDT